MTYSDASSYFNALNTRDDIISGDQDLVTKSRQLANWQRLVNRQPPKSRRWTLKDVVHGVFGAGLGAGIAKGVNAVLPVSDRFADKIETAAMGIGAAMNTGAIKWASSIEEEVERINLAIPKIAEQRRNAFRIGFLKAARDLGLLKKQAFMPFPVVGVGVGDILNIPRAAARGLTSTGRTIGSVAGTAGAPDETEEELTKMELDKLLLEEQLQRLRADKRNAALRKVLAKR